MNKQLIYIADSLRLDSLKTELNAINCTSIIITKWKEILKIYINFIKQGKVVNADKTALESYSTNCSDLYGEAIHLARAMANTYNRTYYDVYDGCLQESTPRVTLAQKEFSALVSPNPSNGKLNVALSTEFTGTISVYNVSGRLVLTNNVNKTTSENIDISNENAGMYFIKILSLEGISQEFKVILIKGSTTNSVEKFNFVKCKE